MFTPNQYKLFYEAVSYARTMAKIGHTEEDIVRALIEEYSLSMEAGRSVAKNAVKQHQERGGRNENYRRFDR